MVNTDVVYLIPVFSAISVAFSILKLTGSITWSWALVSTPIWGIFAITFVLFFVSVLSELKNDSQDYDG